MTLEDVGPDNWRHCAALEVEESQRPCGARALLSGVVCLRRRPMAPDRGAGPYGWGWLIDLLEKLELEPHLFHPSRCKAIASARLKNDKVDAATLAPAAAG
jgi:hypothetical protein